MNRQATLSNTVKMLTLAVALGGAAFAAPSFAAQTTAPSQLNAQAAATSQTLAQADATIHAKTRAEVYQELVMAEQDGELARENATYEGH